MAEWMSRTETAWRAGKKASQSQDTSAARYLNNHQNLTRQQVTKTRLVYGGKGSNLRAAVLTPKTVLAQSSVPVQGFVLDQNFYEIYADSSEAHYLAAILNTDYANDAIKASQTQGAFTDPRKRQETRFCGVLTACDASVARTRWTDTRGPVRRY